jgi:hypothetical protein
MKVRLAVGLCAAIGIGFASTAFAVMGPEQATLRISQMYVKNAGGAIYVAFQQGAMPGCYSNAGGYLRQSNTFFKEIYAQLLTIAAGVGIRASVLYTQNTATGNWGDCDIDGIYLLPE